MEEHHSGPIYSRSSTGVQAPLQEGTTGYRDPINEVLTTRENSNNRGDKFTLRQEGDSTYGTSRRLCEQHIHGTKDQWEGSAHSQFEESQHVPRVRALQDGGHTMHKGPAEQERVHVQVGSQGCVPDSPGTSLPLEISSVPLAGQGIRVHSPSVRSSNSPQAVHEASEASLGKFEDGRCEADRIPGRLPDHRQDEARSRRSLHEDEISSRKSWLYSKCRKVITDSDSEDRILGLHHRLGKNGHQPTSAKDERHSIRVSPFAPGQGDNRTQAGPTCGHAGSHKSCSSSCSPSLPGSTGTKDRCSSPPPLIRICSDSESSEHSGSEMVDRPSHQAKWQSNSTVSSDDDNRVRCVKLGLGGMLQQPCNRGTVVCLRDPPSHQCQGTTGSLPCSPDICQRQDRHPHSSENRQHHSCLFYQSKRGYTFQDFDGHHLTDVGLVHGEEDLHLSRASTWQTEYSSRSGIQSKAGQLGVEAQPISFQATDDQAGSMPNRPVRFKADDTAPRIFQLETRSQLGSDKCSGSELGRNKMLCLPSFRSDREVSGQSEQGKSTRTGVDCTSLANTTLVSTNDINVDSAANTPPKWTNATAESQERDTPAHPSGLTKSGRMGCVRSSLQSQGVSDGASKLILASWRPNTEAAYSANWGRWAGWCQQNGYNQLSAPIGAILDFLTHEFAEGKQYRTLNSYRSAISMTHPPIDGTVIGKHPLVVRLMRGIFNSRPPQPRYSCSWDVGRVLEFIRSLGDNEVLTLKDLTHKLATIMALANASRASEIHALNVKYMRRVTSGVQFNLAQLTKTSRPGKQRSLFYPCLKEDKILCPVVTLQHYLERTQEYRKSESSRDRLFFSSGTPL